MKRYPTDPALGTATHRANTDHVDRNIRWQTHEFDARRGERLIRLPEVKQRTGLSRSSIYLKIAAGRFPPQIQLGIRMVAWYESQVEAWIADPR